MSVLLQNAVTNMKDFHFLLSLSFLHFLTFFFLHVKTSCTKFSFSERLKPIAMHKTCSDPARVAPGARHHIPPPTPPLDDQ